MTSQIRPRLRARWIVNAAAAVAAAFACPLAHAQEQPAAAPLIEEPADAGQPVEPELSPGAQMQPPSSAAPTEPLPDTPQGLAGSVVGHGELPHDLSPWSMFLSADIVVKAVMIGLAFASLVTWTVWFAKSIELAWARRQLARSSRRVATAVSLAEARQAIGEGRGIVPGLLALAATELSLSAGIADRTGLKERVASRLDGLTLAAGRDMNRGTGVLATIGSTAPFVGLFGTVWGIMNSFIGIAESQTTNLAIVAPGIAEALLATAIGLVAAIPAVIIYNQFARSIASYRAAVAETSAEVVRLVSRDLDRGAALPLARAAE